MLGILEQSRGLYDHESTCKKKSVIALQAKMQPYHLDASSTRALHLCYPHREACEPSLGRRGDVWRPSGSLTLKPVESWVSSERHMDRSPQVQAASPATYAPRRPSVEWGKFFLLQVLSKIRKNEGNIHFYFHKSCVKNSPFY